MGAALACRARGRGAALAVIRATRGASYESAAAARPHPLLRDRGGRRQRDLPDVILMDGLAVARQRRLPPGMNGVRLTVLLAFAALALPFGAAASGPSSQVQEGDHLYGQYCLSCHASPARGAPSLRGVGALAADFYLRTGYMPLPHLGMQPRRRRVLLTEPQIQALTAYIASLGPGPAIPTPHPERGSLSEG